MASLVQVIANSVVCFLLCEHEWLPYTAAVTHIGNHWREYKYADKIVSRALQRPIIYNHYIGFDYTSCHYML